MKRIQFPFRFLFLLAVLLPYKTSYATYSPVEIEDSNKSNNYDTYMGVNFKQNWIKPRGGWNNLFVKEQPGFNVYFGWRFHPNFGAELGYEWTDNKPKAFAVQPGSTLLGVLNNSGAPVTLTGKVRFKTGAADLNAFIPLCAEPLWEDVIPEGIISVGVAGMKASMKIFSTTPATPFSNQFTTIQGRSKAVYRAGLGVQALIIENFGIRVLWRVESTSFLRGRNSLTTTNNGTRVIFKNANTLAVGLFFKF
ncbi:MAG TPA: hypothetical protein PLV31_02180 [Gammaproteobacteria bacterium]|nr:hypothetical protein [Gammaproteobacteria bacterium]HRA42481.1 hypothetical protein [Gammaproteobacteria bacterium]